MYKNIYVYMCVYIYIYTCMQICSAQVPEHEAAAQTQDDEGLEQEEGHCLRYVTK